MGSRAHREVQEARLRGAAEYLSEVPVRRELEVSGYRVTIQGRVDGVLRSADGSLLVEEIKSLALPPLLFREDELAPRREHRLQLEIYCALLAEPGRPVRGLLTLYNLVDGGRLEILIDVDPAAAMDEIHRRIAALLRRLEDEAERLEARAEWAERLVFPFPEPRPHQQEMVAALEESWERGRDVLLSAPSGTGKTAAALFAALRQAFRRRLRVFFVTAKNTQQKLAAETLEELARASEVPLRALVLRAKERMCLGDGQLCGEEICPWLEEYAERAERWGLPGRLLDRPVVHPEAIIAAAKEARICPFELSLDLLPLVDVVVGDYNYVFDPSVSLSCFQEGTARDVLLVVDEAHNLLERGRDYYSPALERRQVEDALRLLAGGDPAQPVLDGADETRRRRAGGSGTRRRHAGGDAVQRLPASDDPAQPVLAGGVRALPLFTGGGGAGCWPRSRPSWTWSAPPSIPAAAGLSRNWWSWCPSRWSTSAHGLSGRTWSTSSSRGKRSREGGRRRWPAWWPTSAASPRWPRSAGRSSSASTAAAGTDRSS
jgi:hypothetical protein